MSIFKISSDRSIYYEFINKDSEKPYLIFLHEALGCVPMWKNFPERLCRETKCPGLLFDRTGHGQSSPLNSARSIHYMHEYALNELPEVVNNLIPGREHILIGHSDGGSISLIYGAKRPPLLKGIITEAAHVFVESETIEGIRATDNSFERGNLKGLYKYHGEKTYQIFKAWSETWLSEWFKYWNIEYLLPSIKCPVLVTQGTDDQYGTEHQVNSILSKCSGISEFCLVENCGHIPHLEQPELLIKTISGFVEKVENDWF